MPARVLTLDDDGTPEDRLATLIEGMDRFRLRVFLSGLTPHDLTRAKAILQRRRTGMVAAGWRSDPVSFACHLDPTYRRWAFTAYLAERFVSAVTTGGSRQIWNVASRYGKTTLLRMCIAWALDNDPTGRWIVTAYGDDLAGEFGDALKQFLDFHADELTVQLRRDRGRSDRWWTSSGGGLLARGMNSAIIGYGANRAGGLIVDDPMKGWQEAHSKAARLKVVNTFKGVLRHRLDSEDAPILITHARWHRDDITGVLRKEAEDETGEAWEVVALPVFAVAGDPLGRPVGEVLEPGIFTADQAHRRARALGSYLASALEQQDPTDEAGTDLLREWFRLEDVLPTRFDIMTTSWDLKLKDKEAGDYVVGQAWGRVGATCYLLDQVRGNYDHATTQNAIALLAVRNPTVRSHAIEAAGSADSVVPQLRKAQRDYVVTAAMAGRLGMTEDETAAVQALRRRGMTGLVTVAVKGGKDVRAREWIAPLAEGGNVVLPARASFTPALLDELAAFPGGTHDDQVDAMSQALKRLQARRGATSSTSGRVPEAPKAVPRPRAPTTGLSRLPPRRG